MRSAALRIAVAAGVLAACAPARAEESAAGQFQAGLTAAVSLTDLAGAPLDRPRKGEPFRIEVALRDAATPSPPKGVALKGWIRREAASNAACREAGRGFRVTDRIARGAIDLNGVLFAALFRDGGVGTIDPKLDLRSSNMLAAAKFDAPPNAFAVDPRRQVAYLAFREQSAVFAVSLLDGAKRRFAEGLDAPSGVVASASGDVWISERDAVSRLDASGATLSRTIVGAPLTIVAGADALLAFAGNGPAIVFDAASGAERMQLDLGRVSAAALARDGALVTLDGSGSTIAIRFLDRPGQVERVALRAPATALAAQASGALPCARSGALRRSTD